MRPSYQQPLHPPLSHKHNPTLIPGSSPVCGGVSLWIPPSSSCQPLTARLGTVPTAVLQDSGSASERKKKKTQEKQQNTPSAASLGFFAATLLGKALQAPASHSGHTCLHTQRRSTAKFHLLPNAATSGTVKNWGIFPVSAKRSGHPPSLAGLAKPPNIHKSISKQATNPIAKADMCTV